jgi:hypothetical protein
VWGFDWDERWLQCCISLAFGGMFLLLSILVAAKVRYVK